MSQYYVSPENHNENQQHSDILVGGMPNFLQGLCHWFGAVTFLSGQLLLGNRTLRLVLVLGLHSLAIDSSCSKTLMSFECFSFLFFSFFVSNESPTQHQYAWVFSFFTVGKAFAVATAVIFGGATLIFGLVVSKLELQNVSN